MALPTIPPTATSTVTPIPPTATYTHTPTVTPTATSTPTATYTSTPTATDTIEPTAAVNVCASRPAVLEGSRYRLTIVNKSGYDIYMQLESCSYNGSYYLSIPAGSSEKPTTKVFSVLSGAYQNTVIYCNGNQTINLLVLSSDLKLTYSSCELTATATATP
jgi:hypothetical protein